MAHVDLLLRARQEADIWTINALLPAQFQLFNTSDNTAKKGIAYVTDGLNPLVLQEADDTVSPSLLRIESPWWHANIRVGPPLLSGVKLPGGDADADDDKNLFRRHARQNGVTRTDDASDHPRTGRSDMGWYRINGPGGAWVEIMQAKPGFRRGTWAGDPENPDV